MAQLPNLPLIQERFYNVIKDSEVVKETKYRLEFSMWMFPQTWGSTALGFGGIGGQAITEAYTVVVHEDISNYVGVFFGERLAYSIHNPNRKFWKDVSNNLMEPLSKRGKYIRNNGE